MPTIEPMTEKKPFRMFVEIIAGKWTPMIVYVLSKGQARYGDIQRAVPGISKKVLTQSLRSLEKDGLVTRKVFEIIPPHVEYRLTPLGKKFIPPLQQLCEQATRIEPDLKKIARKRKSKG